MDTLHEAIHRRDSSTRTIAFWFFTAILAQELLAGSIWALLRNPFDTAQLAHLGYPLYLLYILGTWKLGGVVVILLPRLQRLKEWAYAGALVDFSGGAASHLFLHDGPQTWVYPAILVAVTLASSALRPERRRLHPASSEGNPTIASWAIPIGLAAAMLVLALLTLPKGISPTGTPAW